MNRNKFLALIICIVFVFFTAVSAEIVITGAEHDCTGEDCAVCLNIDHFQKIIKDLQGAVVFNECILRVFVALLAVVVLKCTGNIFYSTPVILKDKLSN